jgi:hypothetical protein
MFLIWDERLNLTDFRVSVWLPEVQITKIRLETRGIFAIGAGHPQMRTGLLVARLVQAETVWRYLQTPHAK